MSCHKIARTFPPRGSFVKMQTAISPINSQIVAQSIARALRNAVSGLAAPSKQLSRMTGKCPRTIRNLMDASNAPSAATLIELMRDFDEVHEVVMTLAQRNLQNENADDVHQRIQAALKILSGEEERANSIDRIS